MDEILNLESLPNELLLDIFAYIPVQDLYETFFNLNTRLTAIINSFQGFYFEQLECQNIEDSTFNHRITTLVVRHSEPINLHCYPRLRALKLEWPSEQQCYQTTLQSQLEHLYIGHAFQEGDTQQLLKYVFTNGFPYLRSCHLENLTRSVLNESSTILSNMKSMKIFTIYPMDIAHVLFLCPNLTRLSIKFFSETIIDLNIFKQRLPTLHKNLRTLILDSVDQMSIATIESILEFVPNIKYLSIISPRCRQNKVNINHIAHSLYRRLPDLHKFYARIWCDDLLWNSIYTNNIETIRSLHPLFKYIQLSSRGGRLIISSSSYRNKLL